MALPHNDPKNGEASENLDYKYPGTANLVLIETALTNYNEWVVDKFICACGKKKTSVAKVLDFGSGLGTLCKIFFRKTGIRPDAFDIDASHRAEIAKNGFHAYGNIDELPRSEEHTSELQSPA